MNVERLRKILTYSKKNREETNRMVRRFCSLAEIEYENDILNIMQIARASFLEMGYLMLELPFADDEIGALCYKGDGLGYVVINTSLPRVNSNFAVAHEIYHVLFQESEFISKVEFSDDYYYEHEEEYMANLFAGMLLMPETSFRRMYRKFRDESDGDELDTIIRLMAYYQVPYMSVLIRCLEIELPGNSGISAELLDFTGKKIKGKFEELWLDDSILYASNRDDYPFLEAAVKKFGGEYVGDGYLSERTLTIVLQNMRKLYKKIKGE